MLYIYIHIYVVYIYIYIIIIFSTKLICVWCVYFILCIDARLGGINRVLGLS